MADFMLSYSSTNTELADELKDELEARGRTVWKDDERRGDGDYIVGVPGGQKHWPLIQAAIDQAGTVLILETAAWGRSKYCRDELEYARKRGKRVAVVLASDAGPTEVSDGTDVVVVAPTSDVDTILGALGPGDDLAAAHARLLRDASSERKRGLLSERERAKDATTVLTSPLRQFGLTADAPPRRIL